MAAAVAAGSLKGAAGAWVEGSGVMLTVPPLGSIGDITGQVWGLQGDLTRYQVGMHAAVEFCACLQMWSGIDEVMSLEHCLWALRLRFA